LPRPVTMPLATPLPPTGNRAEFIRARIDDGSLVALGEQDSSALASLARAVALIERPAGSPAVDAGAWVKAYSLENGGVA